MLQQVEHKIELSKFTSNNYIQNIKENHDDVPIFADEEEQKNMEKGH